MIGQCLLLKILNAFGFQPLIVGQFCNRIGDAFTKSVFAETRVAFADDHFATESKVVANESSITDAKTNRKRFVV